VWVVVDARHVQWDVTKIHFTRAFPRDCTFLIQGTRSRIRRVELKGTRERAAAPPGATTESRRRSAVKKNQLPVFSTVGGNLANVKLSHTDTRTQPPRRCGAAEPPPYRGNGGERSAEKSVTFNTERVKRFLRGLFLRRAEPSGVWWRHQLAGRGTGSNGPTRRGGEAALNQGMFHTRGREVR